MSPQRTQRYRPGGLIVSTEARAWLTQRYSVPELCALAGASDGSILRALSGFPIKPESHAKLEQLYRDKP